MGGAVSPDELLSQSDSAWRGADFARALALADRACEQLLGGDAPSSDPRRGVADTLRALALRDLGRLEEARAAGERAVNAARERGWLDALPRAMLALGRVHVGRGDPPAARPLLSGARALFEARQDILGLADCAVEEGVLALREGRVEDCEGHIARAVVGYDDAGDARSAGLALLVVVQARRSVGDFEGARAGLRDSEHRLEAVDEPEALLPLRASQVAELLAEGHPGGAVRVARDALTRAAGQGSASLRARLWKLVGDGARQEHDHEEAERAYERSAELYATAGDQDEVIPRAHRAMDLIDQGRYDEARPTLAALLERIEGHHRVNLEALLHALMLPCAVDARDWSAWGHHYGRAEALTRETRLADPHAADAARRAAELCARAAWSTSAWTGAGPDLLAAAVRGYTLALVLYRRLAREDDAVSTARALQDLGRRGAPLPVGPFDLRQALGRGAMGEVWRASHHSRRDPVAVKVVAPAALSDERFQALIESEIEAMATLDHPNIVQVLDHGVLGPEAEAVGHGTLRRDSPWFAMELATGGSLEPLCGTLTWDACRQILLVLLDALAHAHARGVYHLDLKPSNVLLRESGDGTRTVLLTDFGLAHIVARASGGLGVAGTPAFMAPEQFEGDARDYGPWTDLYGFGCLATHLVQGHPPFEGDGLEAQRAAHLEQELPELAPAVDVPDGLGGWLGRLLAKDPRDRFRQAADAAWALRRLDAPGLPEDRPTPDAWEMHRPRDPGRALEAAPQLFRLRRPPLVGRHVERDRLWTALREVAGGQAGLVVLVGGQGAGKMALSRWLGERAQELGVATVLDGGDRDDAQPAFTAMVVRRLRLEGLSEEEAQHRVERTVPGLSETAAAHLATIAVAWGRGLSTRQRVQAVRELVVALARERPVVVRVELGNPVSLDAAALAEALLHGDARVLLVLEADTEVGLEPVLAQPGASVVRVGSMRDRDLRELIDTLVPLEPQLEARVIEQAAGNPDHVVRVVTDLVERDALRVTPVGWALRPGARIALPQALRDRYGERVGKVRDALAGPAREAIAAAALLGIEVPSARWRAITEQVGLHDAGPVMRRLSTAFLAESTDEGWRFSHPAARELIRQSWGSREASRVAARVLDAEGGDRGMVGWMWADAEDLPRAVQLLLEGARVALDRGEGDRALELIDRRADALRTLGIAEDAAEWAGDALIRAELATRGGGRRSGRAAAERAVELAVRHELDEVLAGALAARGAALHEEGHRGAAREGYEEALVAFDALDIGVGVARCLRRLGDLARAEGDLDEADRLYQRAASRLKHGDGGQRESLLIRASQGMIRVAQDRLSEAEDLLLLVLQDAEDGGGPDAAIEALSALGNVARQRGELQLADARYRAALSRIPAWRSRRAALVRVNQALGQLAAGRIDKAAAILDQVLGGAEIEHRGPVEAWCRLAQLAVIAPQAEDAVWNRHLALAERIVAEARLWERDAAWLLELAGRRACDAQHFERAERPWRLAEQVYRAAGRPVAAERVARSRGTLARGR